jgi:hypothetical protein
MRNTPKILLAVALASAALTAHATITFTTIGADELFANASGTIAAPANSLVLLVADTTGGGFGNLDAGNISVGATIDSGGNDLVVGQLSTFTTGILDFSGGFSINTTVSTPTSGIWIAGDALAIYWIPSLTTSSSTVSSDVAYGIYTSAVNSTPSGSDAWITPTDGSNYPAIYFESSGDEFFGSDNAPADTGDANLLTAVIPEPADAALLCAGAALGLVWFRRRKLSAPAVMENLS